MPTLKKTGLAAIHSLSFGEHGLSIIAEAAYQAMYRRCRRLYLTRNQSRLVAHNYAFPFGTFNHER
jgi:hypothetical protein